ncbi:hypothetical protein D1AOALGA4SA_859 [Olavius algarvensis Delta 1 endosymbiont]|nr:hypothetical protein D1AOALGA4SA_859 [Olavius algarvensis Delta 1 endosymbiont]
MIIFLPAIFKINIDQLTEGENLAEIKSTLDLVMERTKNLTLSSEEKQAQKDKEITNRIKGLVQKLQDGFLKASQFYEAYIKLKKDSDLPDDSLLFRHILTRLDPGRDNQVLLETLEECCRLDMTPIRSIISDYRAAADRAAEKRMSHIKEELAHKHSIAGTAVIPNLEADSQWQQEAQDLQRQFENILSKAFGMTNDQ